MLPAIDGRIHGARIELLYEEYQRPLLAYLTRVVSDREAAEDLCQETFIKALRGWEQRDPSASVAAWVYRICKPLALFAVGFLDQRSSAAQAVARRPVHSPPARRAGSTASLR